MTRKEEILSKATQLFSERGFSAVSMRDIASAIDIKASSLYNHLTSKQEMLSEIIGQLASEFVTHITRVQANSTLNIQQKLALIIEHHINLSLHQPQVIAVLNTEWIHLDGEHLQEFKAKRFDYENTFRQIIKEGISKGELKNLNVEVILFSTLSTLRTLNLWVAKRKHLTPEVLKHDLQRILLSGIV